MELHIELPKNICLICLILNQLQYQNAMNNMNTTHQSFYLLAFTFKYLDLSYNTCVRLINDLNLDAGE